MVLKKTATCKIDALKVNSKFPMKEMLQSTWNFLYENGKWLSCIWNSLTIKKNSSLYREDHSCYILFVTRKQIEYVVILSAF
jgi:hypothetical protein